MSDIKEDVFGVRKALSKYLHRSEYKEALKLLIDLIKRKGPKAHGLEYYADKIGRNFPDVDTRILAKMYREKFPMTEETQLDEAFDIEQVPLQQKRHASLFLGRMQPIHLGHEAIIARMQNPVVALVKGKDSSTDKKRNPFTQEYQIRLLKKLFPKVKIIIVTTGYVPDIISQVRSQGLEIDTVFAGADRIRDYERQISGVNKRLDTNKMMDVTVKETPRVTSATTVRNAIASNDVEAFRKNMPKKLWDEFDTMKKFMGISESINESVSDSDLKKWSGAFLTVSVGLSELKKNFRLYKISAKKYGIVDISNQWTPAGVIMLQNDTFARQNLGIDGQELIDHLVSSGVKVIKKSEAQRYL